MSTHSSLVAKGPADPDKTLGLDKVPARAALEIAEGTRSPAEVLDSYGYTESQAQWLMEHKPFIAQIKRYRADLQANGYTFRSKAGFLAEQHLETVNSLVRDPDTPPHVRLDAVKFLAAMGGVAPKPEAAAAGEKFSLTINMGAGSAPLTIENT